MPYAAVPARLASPVAQQASLSVMWDGCPHGHGSHVARRKVGDPTPYIGADARPPELERGWDGACEDCGASIPWDDDVRLGGGVRTIYDTPSGQLEPGSLYWADWLDNDGRCFYGWSNCDGHHLMAMLPNGHAWDIDSRASNCGSPNDNEHRCWVRHGEPPNVHVDKNGRTCSAGAGSIVGGDYHGFLHGGIFTAG